MPAQRERRTSVGQQVDGDGAGRDSSDIHLEIVVDFARGARDKQDTCRKEREQDVPQQRRRTLDVVAADSPPLAKEVDEACDRDAAMNISCLLDSLQGREVPTRQVKQSEDAGEAERCPFRNGEPLVPRFFLRRGCHSMEPP